MGRVGSRIWSQTGVATGEARSRALEGSRAMADRRFGWILASGALLAMTALPRPSQAQGPTIEDSALKSQAGITTMPGSLNSLLGMLPGSSGVTFGSQPGRDDMLLGRIGTSAPRVP